MIRRAVLHRAAQELPQRQRVSTAPRDPSFGVNPLEVPHHQHPEVHARRDARPASLRVELPALLLGEPVELGVSQDPVHCPVERMTGRPKFAGAHEDRLLAVLFTFPIAIATLPDQ